jgi:hypothetical protein
MIHIPHPFGISGLALNAIGAGMLLWFPPDVRRYTEQGAMVASWVSGRSCARRRSFEN